MTLSPPEATLYPPPYPRPDPTEFAPPLPLRPVPQPPRGIQRRGFPDYPRLVRALLLGAMVVTTCAFLIAFGQALTSPLSAEGFPGPAVVERRGEADHACPVTPPYRFSPTIGDPRSGGRTHKGTDMFGDKDSPVKAVTGGEVTKAVAVDDGTLGGARVWVRGDDGWWWYYAHLSGVHVEVGERVEAGTVLGLMGNTGNARTTPPHLHIEQHLGAMDGPFVDPFVLVNLLCPQ